MSRPRNILVTPRAVTALCRTFDKEIMTVVSKIKIVKMVKMVKMIKMVKLVIKVVSTLGTFHGTGGQMSSKKEELIKFSTSTSKRRSDVNE